MVGIRQHRVFYIRVTSASLLLLALVVAILLCWPRNTKPLFTIASPARVTALSFAPEGRVLALGTADGRILIRDIYSGGAIQTITNGRDVVRELSYSPQGDALVSSDDSETVSVWDSNEGTRRFALPGDTASISPDGERLCVVPIGKAGQVCDLKTGKVLNTIQGMCNLVPPMSVAWLTGKHVVACGPADRSPTIWDGVTGAKVRALDAPTRWVTVMSLAIVGDGAEVAAGTVQGDVIVWDVKTGMVKAEMDQTSVVGGLCLIVSASRRKGIVAAGEATTGGLSSARIVIWDIASKEKRGILYFSRPVSCLAFSPDGKVLAAGIASEVRIWDVDALLGD